MGKKSSRQRAQRHNMQKQAAQPWSDSVLHLETPQSPSWRWLLPALALAFAARAVVALSGDFVLHPDEIMQYLEPAHRLVFGNGVIYWEYFYGARSWLVPGMVAGVIALLDALGLGQPYWYSAGVKLLFCLISLLIPACMYYIGRWHFSELTARIALITGAFWYELVGFAHKPMTEFVATGLLLALLALCLRPTMTRPAIVAAAAVLAALTIAVRVQYMPLALLLLGIFFLRADKRLLLVLAFAAVVLALGIFDALSWNGGLFHSYLINILLNLEVGRLRAGETPFYQFGWWLLLASAGLSALCAALGLGDLKRYGLLLTLVGLALVIHSMQAHKEYRFIFVIIPLWLLLGSDLAARLITRLGRRYLTLVGAPVTLLSVMGLLNALPYQQHVYEAYSRETGQVRFLHDQDPIFAAYRYLASAPDVKGVWQPDRFYYNTPGYYYLHHRIPFYDQFTGRPLAQDQTLLSASVSHIVAALPGITIPGYVLEREFGDMRIWRRADNDAPVRQWRSYTPSQIGVEEVMARIWPDAPKSPANSGISFLSAPGQE